MTKQLLVLALCAPAVSLALGLPDDRPERERIIQQRQMLVESFRRDELRCREQFAVTGCIEQVRERRRAALGPLRERELQLDALARQQRAEQRRGAMAEREQRQHREGGGTAVGAAAASAQARVRAPVTGSTRAGDAREAPGGTFPSATDTPRAARAPRAPLEGEVRRDAPAAAARRASEAEARQTRIEQRIESRQAQGKPARPLPVPAAASAAARS